jgi:hypothetical protein
MTTTTTKWAGYGAVAILLASGGFWTGKSLTTPTVTPQVSSGTVGLVSITGDAFTFQAVDASQAASYALPASLPWRDSYGTWHEGEPPACMKPLSHGQYVTIGVINAGPVANAPGGPVIVWVQCAPKPIPRYPIVTPSPAATP